MVIQLKERGDVIKHMQVTPRELVLVPWRFVVWYDYDRKQPPLLRFNSEILSSMPSRHDFHPQLGQSFGGEQSLPGGLVW